MGLRFRKRIKLFPGVAINIGKTGVTSCSIGGKGLTVNVSKKGTRATVGIPGTGISYTEKISSNTTPKTKKIANQFQSQSYISQTPSNSTTARNLTQSSNTVNDDNLDSFVFLNREKEKSALPAILIAISGIVIVFVLIAATR